MKKSKFSTTKCLTIILIFLMQFSLFAQEDSGGGSSFKVEDGSSEVSDESTFNIDVTAQKRKQKIQDVAGSVSAFNSKQVEDASIDSTNEISTYVPNFSTFGTTSGGMGFSYYGIRGQTNFNSFSNSVGIYIDGVPRLLSGNVTDSSIMNIDQIEVLRGPQGNLYGLSSSGGIVNITTKNPENFWTGSAGASYGSYNAQKYKASVSGPVISEKLFVSVWGEYKYQDSFVEEEGNDDRYSRYGSGHVQIRWTPADKVEVLLNAESGVQKNTFAWFTLVDDDPFKIPSHNHDEYDKSRYHVQSLKIKWETPYFDLVSVTGNSILKEKGEMEYFTNGAMFQYYDMPTIKTMEELRLVSNDKKSVLKWMVGAFAQTGSEEYNNLQKYSGSSIKDLESETKSKTYAFFGQASYTLFQKLTLTAGLRYDYQIQEYKEKSSGINMSTSTPYTTDYDESESWDALSPRVALDFRINDEIMVYTSAAKGYKSGGFTANDAVDQKYDQEEVWSYELGTKTNWLKNRIVFNICGFYTVANDLQTFYYNEGYQFVYENTAKAVMYGVETEIMMRPLSGLELSVPLGYVSTEIKEHEVESNEGNKVPMTPEFTAGLNVQYTHSTGFYARGEWKIQGKTYYDEENEVGQDAYRLLNFKLGCKREHFTVSAFINNALDEEYYLYIYNNSPYDFGALGAPRNIGAEISLEF